MTGNYGIAVIGTSWGGLNALRELVAALPGDLRIPVVVVQHRHRESNHALAGILQDQTQLHVCEVEDKAPIVGESVYVAPADYHLYIEPEAFALSKEEPVRYSRPSIDLTFASAATAFGPRAIGVILTGANVDGADGLARIVAAGGLAIVQEPTTAESTAMPRAAIKAVPVARVMTVSEIGATLGELARTA